MKDSLKYLSLITQVGLNITITIFLFTILGVYLDRRFNTKAIFTLVLIISGCISALVTTYKIIIKSLPEDTKPK